jgi:hypothetical protein
MTELCIWLPLRVSWMLVHLGFVGGGEQVRTADAA